jgi:glycosyltransferase involved in cell wall biosynthesis
MVTGDEKLQLLADANIWALPSYSENFGLAVAEAMACRLPVVVSDRVNIQEAISEAGAGRVVSCDAQEIAGAILDLAADPALRERMGIAGSRLVEGDFTWDRAAARMIDIYERLARREPLAMVDGAGVVVT